MAYGLIPKGPFTTHLRWGWDFYKLARVFSVCRNLEIVLGGEQNSVKL